MSAAPGPSGLFGQAALTLAVTRLRPYLDASLLADVTGTEQPVTDLGKDLVAEVGLAAAAIRAKLRCIAGYSALSAADQAWFDAAAGTLAAIRLRSSALAQANGGLTKRKAGDEEETFSPPDPGEEKRWAAEFAEAASNIACVQNARVQIAANLSVINVAGRTRTREACGRYSLPVILASLLPAGWGGDRRSVLVGNGLDAGAAPGFF